MKWDLSLYAIRGIPLIKSGDNIGQIIYQCTEAEGFCFEDDDVLIVAHKVISKAENAIVKLSEIVPSKQARDLAAKTGKDLRLCQVYINESSEIVGTEGRMVITWHKLGFRDTSAGADRSNIAPYSEDLVSILPKDPDASARGIRSQLKELSGKELAVIISDTFGNPTRQGSFGVAIGVAGIAPIEIREGKDMFGNQGGAAITTVDALASAAYTIMGQNEDLPAVIVRGARFTRDENASIRNILYRGI
jgi:coenzyme F420-0:L-glutamate ligase/coenzyme F420-1:gamma-L-glutamate ligase